jgi:hypothetical protein
MHNVNGTRPPIAPEPTSEEAAAIIAAVERFKRATAIPVQPPVTPAEGWGRAALAEAVEGWPGADLRDPWINT